MCFTCIGSDGLYHLQVKQVSVLDGKHMEEYERKLPKEEGIVYAVELKDGKDTSMLKLGIELIAILLLLTILGVYMTYWWLKYRVFHPIRELRKAIACAKEGHSWLKPGGRIRDEGKI